MPSAQQALSKLRGELMSMGTFQPIYVAAVYLQKNQYEFLSGICQGLLTLSQLTLVPGSMLNAFLHYTT